MSEASKPHSRDVLIFDARALIEYIDHGTFGNAPAVDTTEIVRDYLSLVEQYEDVKRERDGLTGRNQFLSTEVLRLDILVRSTQEQLEALRVALRRIVYAVEAWDNDEKPDEDFPFDADMDFVNFCGQVARAALTSNPASEGVAGVVGDEPKTRSLTDQTPSENPSPAKERA